ncbi:tRNA (cmo5U34)-methyltransferase [Paenibacillus konkukensis]|uniref:tRNA (Cmo5U34)-methyltransferase n=1 Tax=Paenibacillus konkukensis TaxID=2020716 RepID=A0ABY4RHG7_9BACL|nr:class I SAM-dependent methyltransferase [Paenibacillus konkukensis]UQZ81470.1 tRNA (cmo5U34)-methyltransferase [Paenibacillus konkukensis]
MSYKIKVQFDEAAQSYDRERRKLIPCYDDFYGTAVRWLTLEKENPRILDLGAGTGLLAALAKERYPEARFTLADLSGTMLETARKRFAGDDSAEFIETDYTRHSFRGRYDAVISSLSIHHLSHPEKQALFYNIYDWLEDGGIFINADQVLGLTPYIDSMYKRQWESWIRGNGLPEEAVDRAIERRKLDQNATVGDQIRWIREAGFVDADCVYQYHDFGVFFARKVR